MGTFETIGFGFDIATAISVIGAAVVFVYTISRENKKMFVQEKAEKLFDALSEQQDQSIVLLKIANRGETKEDEIYYALNSTNNHLRRKLLPIFAAFSSIDNMKKIGEMIKKLNGIVNKHSEFVTLKKPEGENNEKELKEWDKKKHEKYMIVIQAIKTYVEDMKDIEIMLLTDIRHKINKESEDDSEDAVEEFRRIQYNEK